MTEEPTTWPRNAHPAGKGLRPCHVHTRNGRITAVMHEMLARGPSHQRHRTGVASATPATYVSAAVTAMAYDGHSYSVVETSSYVCPAPVSSSSSTRPSSASCSKTAGSFKAHRPAPMHLCLSTLIRMARWSSQPLSGPSRNGSDATPRSNVLAL